VGEPDRARIVGALGLLERASQQCDRPRAFPLGDRQSRVQPPEIRQAQWMQPLALFGGIPQRVGRLPHVVLLKPGLCQRATDLDSLVAGEPRLLECAREQQRGVRAAPLTKRLRRLPERLAQRHGAQYTLYTTRQRGLSGARADARAEMRNRLTRMLEPRVVKPVFNAPTWTGVSRASETRSRVDKRARTELRRVTGSQDERNSVS
jgi:hypothetical protein